jgi:hypothetical protein
MLLAEDSAALYPRTMDITPLLLRWPFDTNLIPPGAQYAAIVGNRGRRKTHYLCGICKPLQRPATTDRTLVMSRGKRFESARRLFSCGVLQVKLQNPKRPVHHAGANLLQPAKECRPVRGGLEACTRTSPTRTSKTGHTPTTGPTTIVWCAPKRSTFRTDSSASTNRSRVAFRETLHRLAGPQIGVGTGV